MSDSFFSAKAFDAFRDTKHSLSIRSSKASHTPHNKGVFTLRSCNNSAFPRCGVSGALNTLQAYSLNRLMTLEEFMPLLNRTPCRCCCRCCWCSFACELISSFNEQHSISNATKFNRWFRSFNVCYTKTKQQINIEFER